jgi:hypothetical protein
MQPPSKRFAMEDLKTVDAFQPWTVQCQQCQKSAEMWPDWARNVGKAKCLHCGAIYEHLFSDDYEKRFPSIPFWYRADFRGNVFYALNSEHLAYLEKVIANPLRERPKKNGRMQSFTSVMPFNLPAWMLSASNRKDLLKLIGKLQARKR